MNLMTFDPLRRPRLELTVLRRPLGIERRIDDALELGARLFVAAEGEQRFAQEEVGRGAVRVVRQGRAEVRFRLLLRPAEHARHPEVPPPECPVG